MKNNLLIVAAFCLLASPAHAGLVETFQIDAGNGIISEDTGTFVLTGLVDNGVTFDATLTVTGSGPLDQGGTGLGVVVDSSDLVSNGEFLQFTLAFSNVSGGTVNFDGFQEVDFNSFGSSDSGFLSVDASAATTEDNFFTTSEGGGNVSFELQQTFHAIAGADGPGSNSFRIDDVTASFTGTEAVPEPGTMGLLALVAGAGFLRRRR